jgi:hypothetical protein
MHDFALYNKRLLNNESLMIYDRDDHRNNPTTIEKFQSNMDCLAIDSIEDLGEAITNNHCDVVYISKYGKKNDVYQTEETLLRVVPEGCRLVINAIGPASSGQAHGDVYAYGSHWLSNAFSGGQLPAVPYMVYMPDVNENLREDLGIPENAVVFGRNGGSDTFDIQWAKQVIATVLSEKESVYFLFQNTDKFIEHPRVIHLESTSDMVYKTKFVNSCDAMIHARRVGESFGLSCGEFSVRNKPVITWHRSRERNHIEVLGDRGIYYDNSQDLYSILMSFVPSPDKDWNCYRDYTPEKIMPIFKKVYLS